MFYAVDAATGYIANYALRRKSDAWPSSGGVSSTSPTRRGRGYGVFVATAIRSGPARTSVTSAPPWESPCSIPPPGRSNTMG